MMYNFTFETKLIHWTRSRFLLGGCRPRGPYTKRSFSIQVEDPHPFLLETQRWKPSEMTYHTHTHTHTLNVQVKNPREETDKEKRRKKVENNYRFYNKDQRGTHKRRILSTFLSNASIIISWICLLLLLLLLLFLRILLRLRLVNLHAHYQHRQCQNHVITIGHQITIP